MGKQRDGEMQESSKKLPTSLLCYEDAYMKEFNALMVLSKVIKSRVNRA